MSARTVYLNRFRPSTRTRKNDGNTIACSTGYALHDVWHHLIRKSSFSSVHTKKIVWWRFQKSPIWETFGKDAFSVTVLTGYVWMVGQTGGKKSPFSNQNGYLWTGPKCKCLSKCMVKCKHFLWVPEC